MGRVLEVAPSSNSNLFLPPDSAWLCRGVPYWVINTGAANAVVKRPSDSATVLTVTPGTAAMFILGASWYGAAVSGAVQFGSVYPALRYTVVINTLRADLSVIREIVPMGYDGTQPAAVRLLVRRGAGLGSSHPDNFPCTTGTTFEGIGWAAGSVMLLTVESGGTIGGWGGAGGHGGLAGTGSSAGFAGGDAGRAAVRATIPVRIECHGDIFGGGGGGGGGSSSGVDPTIIGGGGGGGRGMNMTESGVLVGSAGGATGAPARTGSPGTAFGPGAGGAPALTGGPGGTGGGAAASGFAGYLVGGGTGAPGGAAGPAISYLPAAGAPIILAGASNIVGATIAEAS